MSFPAPEGSDNITLQLAPGALGNSNSSDFSPLDQGMASASSVTGQWYPGVDAQGTVCTLSLPVVSSQPSAGSSRQKQQQRRYVPKSYTLEVVNQPPPTSTVQKRLDGSFSYSMTVLKEDRLCNVRDELKMVFGSSVSGLSFSVPDPDCGIDNYHPDELSLSELMAGDLECRLLRLELQLTRTKLYIEDLQLMTDDDKVERRIRQRREAENKRRKFDKMVKQNNETMNKRLRSEEEEFAFQQQRQMEESESKRRQILQAERVPVNGSSLLRGGVQNSGSGASLLRSVLKPGAVHSPGLVGASQPNRSAGPAGYNGGVSIHSGARNFSPHGFKAGNTIGLLTEVPAMPTKGKKSANVRGAGAGASRARSAKSLAQRARLPGHLSESPVVTFTRSICPHFLAGVKAGKFLHPRNPEKWVVEDVKEWVRWARTRFVCSFKIEEWAMPGSDFVKLDQLAFKSRVKNDTYNRAWLCFQHLLQTGDVIDIQVNTEYPSGRRR